MECSPSKLDTSLQTWIFAVSTSFQVHIAKDGERGQPNAVKHETLFHNEDVLAAGEITLLDGRLVSVNSQSGTYRTYGFAEDVRMALREALARMGALGIADPSVLSN